ncbi:hypothetical protein B0T14DRAFT_424150 [Immersiella caudata]|uniref:Uncharacterized protein n=1 Tax=Immersiella caudata TaxID=314043 RepID=A0AA40C6T0_9PEZI|nr:hypothetical protein B0T14DRAFT_424150 [Immersiella caudata]
MASTTFSLEDARRRLDEDGFVHLDDPSIGDRVSNLEQKGFPFISKDGLEFCRRVLDDERIRAVVESILGECMLSHLLRWQARNDRIECFWIGGPATPRCALLVHLHPKEGEARYYKGSHLHSLSMIAGTRLLWETQPSALAEAGCVPLTKPFPNGGM